MDAAFDFGPTDQENYNDGRGFFDSALGFTDGLGSLTNSFGRIVGGIADIREEDARGQAAQDDVQLDREEREAALRNDSIRIQRGDNVQLYYAAAAVGVAVIFLMK